MGGSGTFLSRGYGPGRGRMAVMEKLLVRGTATEPYPEDVAGEKAARLALQKEMDEADEVNFLEEEDMHMFDQEPLSDRFSLVTCNGCKRPIKASQFSAHSERCRCSTNLDDMGLECDGFNGQRKPPRKARNKLLSPHATDFGRLHSQEGEDAVTEEYVGALVGSHPLKPESINGRATKGTINNSSSFASSGGRLHKTAMANSRVMMDGTLRGDAALDQSSSKEDSNVILSSKWSKPSSTDGGLTMTCGVVSQEFGTPYHQNSACISVPQPLATRVYCLNHHDRMRNIVSSLFEDAVRRSNISAIALGEQVRTAANITLRSGNEGGNTSHLRRIQTKEV